MIKNSSVTTSASNISIQIKSKLLYSFIKRAFDIIFSTALLILSSPIWLITVVCIKLSSPGPVFYIAHRVGKDAKVFNMLKFRSMDVDDSANEKSLRPEESRIFPFGRFIRATKIDELPQILNVFLGQMSVVGPRPASVDQSMLTRNGVYSNLYLIKVGLTGPSALYDYIYGDEVHEECEYMKKVFPLRMRLDLLYLYKRSLLYDSKMVVYTVLCVLGSVFRKKQKRILNELIASADQVPDTVSQTGV